MVDNINDDIFYDSFPSAEICHGYSLKIHWRFPHGAKAVSELFQLKVNTFSKLESLSNWKLSPVVFRNVS